MATRSKRKTCEYNVQPEPDDDARVCGDKGVKRATGQKLDIVYCKRHFAVAEGRLSNMGAKVKDV